jgi:signal transduction histidine kinase
LEVVLISVTDCGKGVSQEIQEQIFHPFFTTKPVSKGTGLGLSVSRGIIEAHGGQLYIDNDSPNTRFCILLVSKSNASDAA